MNIPEEIQFIVEKIREEKHEAYLVGGCVRDLLRKTKPKDWDIATNAKPEEIEEIFPKTFSNNNFGTVTVVTESADPTLREVEITPYRIDEKYTDKRHPDEIKWAQSIEEDLSRRDFTVNALALGPDLELVDPFEGQKDLKEKVIKAVGEAQDRFSEDALRMMRAVRFAVSLGEKPWQIEEKTKEGIKKNANLLSFISKERIRDEFLKIINCSNGAVGIEILRRLGLLKNIIPELEEGFGVGQNKHHIYQIYQHSLLSLNYACCNNYSTEVRMASLLHDIGKPRTKEGEGLNSTFYNHEIVGAKIAWRILERLRFSRKEIEKIVKLVRYHLFYYNVGEVTESSVRRLLRKVGREDIEELIEVRKADRIGSGVPKAEPYKLRHLRYIVDKVSRDPISVKMLKVSGTNIMDILNISPGLKIGQILSCLLGQVLSQPERNKKELLIEEIKRLGALSDKELAKLSQEAEEEINKIETKRDQMTKKKYWIT